MVFTAEHIRDQEKLRNAVARAAGTSRLVGTSASGILTGEGEVEGSHGVAVLVLSSDQLQADPFLFESLRGRDDQVAAEIAKTSRRYPEKNLLTVLMPDTYNGQAQQLLRTLHNQNELFTRGWRRVIGERYRGRHIPNVWR